MVLLISVMSLTHAVYGQEKHYLFNAIPVTPQIISDNDSTKSPLDVLHTAAVHTYEATPQIVDGATYWLVFDLEKLTYLFEEHDSIFLNSPNLIEAVYYYQNSGRVDSLSISDFKTNIYKSNKIRRTFLPLASHSILNDRYVLIKVKAHFNGGRWTKNPFYISINRDTLAVDISYFSRSLDRQLPVFLFLGLALALIILNILLYIYARSNVYLYYALFLFFQSVYYMQLSPHISNYFYIHYTHLQHIVVNTSQIIVNLCYLLFIRAFLDMPNQYIRLNKAVTAITYILMGTIIFLSIMLAIDPMYESRKMIMDGQRYFMSLFALYGIIHLLVYRKDNLVYFVVVGTAIFVSGALLTMFLMNIRYMLAGASIESVVFATGLAYRIKDIYEQKINFEKEASQASQQALRAQINPHFIFNALNSIQHLITSNDRKNALRYLTKFSHLLRQILENSIEINVPLQREIELLRLYLELEALRFDQKFDYDILVDDKLDIYNLEMPLFLIQPYVENAIIHGLLPSTSGCRKLDITFTDKEGYILCTIADNGIGRLAAKSNKKKNIYTSRGLSVTKQRLDLINKGKAHKTLVNFEDSASGTKVLINIPKI